MRDRWLRGRDEAEPETSRLLRVAVEKMEAACEDIRADLRKDLARVLKSVDNMADAHANKDGVLLDGRRYPSRKGRKAARIL